MIVNSAAVTPVYPGGLLPVNYTVTDKYGNVVHDYNPIEANLSVSIMHSELGISTTLIENGQCKLCESGLFIQALSIDDVNTKYDIELQVQDNILATSDFQIRIEACPSGYGVSGTAKQCAPCKRGLYSFHVTDQECNECPADLEGIECQGSDIVLISYNYWMSFDDNDSIISSECPIGYCCRSKDGCDYKEHELCTLNRNASIPLCGKCDNGYSELLNSAECGVCDENQFLWAPLLIFASGMAAILFSIYLLCFDHSNPTENRGGLATEERKLSLSTMTSDTVLNDDRKAIQVMLLKILPFYCQGLLAVIEYAHIKNGVFFFVFPILQIFNLSINFGSNDSGYCFMTNLSAKQEILVNLIPSAFLLTVTGLVLMTKCCDIKWMNICCKCNCCCIDCENKRDGEVTYYSAFLKALIITMGSIFSVLFKLLSCREITDGLSVHYYYGDISCYDESWYFALFIMALLLGTWIIFDILLWRYTPNTRQSPNENHLFTLVKTYESKYWYWESVLLSRRFFVAFLSITGDPNHYSYIILMVFLSLYLMAQVQFKPFKYYRINRLEMLCNWVLLVVVGFVSGTGLSSSAEDLLQASLRVMLLICIMSPMVLVAYEMMRVCRHRKIENVSISEKRRIIDRLDGNVVEMNNVMDSWDVPLLNADRTAADYEPNDYMLMSDDPSANTLGTDIGRQDGSIAD